MLKNMNLQIWTTGLFALFLTTDGHKDHVFRYKICDVDFANQISAHVSAVAHAIRKERPVEILDDFTVDSDTKSRIPLSTVIDTRLLVETIWSFGVDAKLVAPDPLAVKDLACFSIATIEQEDAEIAATILQAIKPTHEIESFVSHMVLRAEMKGLDLADGVCVHDPSSSVWDRYCTAMDEDDQYHSNCHSQTGSELLDSLMPRSLVNEKRWVYYVGERMPPTELLASPNTVVSKLDLRGDSLTTLFPFMQKDTVQHMWSVVDAMICKTLPHFVGNSHHTWSALQLAWRQSEAKPRGGIYWTNRQGIPLSESFPIFQMPIVYTYTELSAGAGKYMLKASLSSVKRHMPRNTVHVIYHGEEDTEFRSWLEKQEVILHQHSPSWRASIEQMRQKGDPLRSHLFLHEGSYFGTWQRVDIPMFIDSEYCLLMDADTIVVRPFTMYHFGQNMTKTLAFSAEADPTLILPWNAGVSLMNVPFLRASHSAFINFILQHVDGSPYDPDAPSDQGAYLDFYKGNVDFLAIDFNFKPYYQVKPFEAASKRILHFHGPKPHHYIGHFLGLPCDAAAQTLCDQASTSPRLCDSVAEFAKNLLHSGNDNPTKYCSTVYNEDANVSDFCSFLLSRLGEKESRCHSLATEVKTSQRDLNSQLQLKSKAYEDPGVGEFKYNVCNGLSNQVSLSLLSTVCFFLTFH